MYIITTLGLPSPLKGQFSTSQHLKSGDSCSCHFFITFSLSSSIEIANLQHEAGHPSLPPSSHLFHVTTTVLFLALLHTSSPTLSVLQSTTTCKGRLRPGDTN